MREKSFSEMQMVVVKQTEINCKEYKHFYCLKCIPPTSNVLLNSNHFGIKCKVEHVFELNKL